MRNLKNVCLFLFYFNLLLTTNCQALSPCVPPTPLPIALNHEGHGHETNSPTPMPPCLPPTSNETTAETTTVTTVEKTNVSTIYASSTSALFATHIFFIVVFFKL